MVSKLLSFIESYIPDVPVRENISEKEVFYQNVIRGRKVFTPGKDITVRENIKAKTSREETYLKFPCTAKCPVWPTVKWEDGELAWDRQAEGPGHVEAPKQSCILFEVIESPWRIPHRQVA